MPNAWRTPKCTYYQSKSADTPPPQQKYSSLVQKCAFLGRNWDKAGISQRATLWFNSIPTFDLLPNTLILILVATYIVLCMGVDDISYFRQTAWINSGFTGRLLHFITDMLYNNMNNDLSNHLRKRYSDILKKLHCIWFISRISQKKFSATCFKVIRKYTNLECIHYCYTESSI